MAETKRIPTTSCTLHMHLFACIPVRFDCPFIVSALKHPQVTPASKKKGPRRPFQENWPTVLDISVAEVTAERALGCRRPSGAPPRPPPTLPPSNGARATKWMWTHIHPTRGDHRTRMGHIKLQCDGEGERHRNSMGRLPLEMSQSATRIRLPTAGRRDRRRGNRITQSSFDVLTFRRTRSRRSARCRGERQDLVEMYSGRLGPLVPLVI
jgi:hypothetical protein